MAFFERTGIEYQNFWATVAADLVAAGGWAIYDDQLSASGYIVMEMNTSEGAGNEIYVQFSYEAGRTDLNEFDIYMGTEWDNVAHAWVGEYTDHQRHHSGESNSSPTQLMGYYLVADTDHAVICSWAEANSFRPPPIYVGLLDKFHPTIDAQTQSAVCMVRYTSNTGDNTYTNDQNRIPILRGWDGGFNGYGRMCKETIWHRDQDHHNYLGWGPWGDDNYISSSRISIWEDGWGMRGYLKSLRTVADSNSSTLVTGDIVNINGEEWIWWYPTEHSENIAKYGSWTLWLYTTGDKKHGIFLRKGNV